MSSRARALAWLAAIVLGVALAAGGWWWQHRGVESTKDAQVAGDVVPVTSEIAAPVLAVHVEETDRVHAGELLVTLDDADAGMAVAKARAALRREVSEVSELFARRAVAAAAVTGAQARFEQARADLQRRRGLARRQTISQEDLQHAEQAFAVARADLAMARRGLAAAEALVRGFTVATHPRVEAARARLMAALLELERTRIRAPVTGQVARRRVQPGQRVSPGARLMVVVPLESVWVDANFKETQIADLRLGQPVRLVSDLYGGDVVFRGRVAGLSAGTGSVFSLLPPQNATGNWIKIVQRVPVRIRLDPGQLREHPLMLGLSMHATVDTRDRSGRRLRPVSRRGAGARTEVLDGRLVRARKSADEFLIATLQAAGESPPVALSSDDR